MDQEEIKAFVETLVKKKEKEDHMAKMTYLGVTWLSKDDILAHDWEVEPEPEQNLKAWINIDHGNIHFGKSNETILTGNGTWQRAPWLDQKD